MRFWSKHTTPEKDITGGSKPPFHWRILNRHNQLGSDKLITSLPDMPNRQ
jgi:hypothetical protein